MDNLETNFRSSLEKLALHPLVADIYLTLHANGPLTISELSRKADIERTRIYRMLDELAASGLVEIERHYKRDILKAAPINNLRIMIDQKESQLNDLKESVGILEEQLAAHSLRSPTTEVQFYAGPQGIRQMLWNELRAQHEVVGYQYRILEEATGTVYMQRWTEAFERRGLLQRLIYSDAYVKSWNENKAGLATQQKVSGIDYRYIAAKQFLITHSCDTYDDITAYFHWKDGDIFGIEIHNQEIANSQRQFFELLWQQAVARNQDLVQPAA